MLEIKYLRWTILTFSSLLLAVGVGVFVFSLWLVFDTGNSESPGELVNEGVHLMNIHGSMRTYYVASFMFVVVGLLLMFSSIVGWLGAWRESAGHLIGYAAATGIMATLAIAAGNMVHSGEKDILKGLDDGILDVVKNRFEEPGYTQATKIVNYIQERYNCCGSALSEDWELSTWERRHPNRVPASCCFGFNGVDITCEPIDPLIGGDNIYLHKKGCAEQVGEVFKKNISSMLALGVILTVAGLVVAIVSIMFIVAIRVQQTKLY